MSSELLRFFRHPQCKIPISDDEKIKVVRMLANAGLETIADFQNVVVSDIVGYKEFHPGVQTALAKLPSSGLCSRRAAAEEMRPRSAEMARDSIPCSAQYRAAVAAHART